MTRRSRPGARGIVAAALLAIVALLVAALCFRSMVGNMLAESDPTLERLMPGEADAVLDDATAALVRQYGHLDAATFAAVRRAAAEAPLDARPYLILGHQQLLDRQPQRALATFETGQRLDPRIALIHVLLLDRYLRTGRYPAAAAQMAVLTRTIGATQAPIAKAFAAMVLAPQTRDAVDRTLRADPILERAVLIALAKANVDPATIIALASPAARADAGNPESWGPVLVSQLVDQHRYAAARAVWRDVYRIDGAAAASPVFDAAFRPSPAAPPFNWTLAAGSVGAADMKGGGLAIDYYGRDSGDLASQLLVLAPGRWRFAFTVDPGKSDAGSRLLWSIGCAGNDKPLATLPRVAGPTSRRLFADFVVPAGCPTQRLVLRGEAGDLPAPVSITVRAPAVTAATAVPEGTP